MRAISIVPGTAGSVRLDEVPDPPLSDGPVLARTLAVGVCGTDIDLVAGSYGWAAEGRERLVIGHESLARVEEAPPECGLKPGDHIVGIVRRPDPVPCPNCAVGEWDMCRNGAYTERGIKGRDGYASDRFRIRPEYAVPVDPSLGLAGVLLEPASVVAKAWEHVVRIGRRAVWEPRRALVTGAGPVGLLAAMLGVQRGLEVHVFDRVTDGPKPALVRDLGAVYHSGDLRAARIAADVVIECTGASGVILDVIGATAAAGIVCLAGVSSGGRSIGIDLGRINRAMVLENDVVFGSVNANRRHYDLAARGLAKADRDWLHRIVSRRVPVTRWAEAFVRKPDDVKVVIQFED